MHIRIEKYIHVWILETKWCSVIISVCSTYTAHILQISMGLATLASPQATKFKYDMYISMYICKSVDILVYFDIHMQMQTEIHPHYCSWTSLSLDRLTVGFWCAAGCHRDLDFLTGDMLSVSSKGTAAARWQKNISRYLRQDCRYCLPV